MADGVKSAASDPEVSKNIETAAKARLELLEQEKIMITQVLQKGQADEADAGDVQVFGVWGSGWGKMGARGFCDIGRAVRVVSQGRRRE